VPSQEHTRTLAGWLVPEYVFRGFAGSAQSTLPTLIHSSFSTTILVKMTGKAFFFGGSALDFFHFLLPLL
jgi:hypothetical protein